MSYDELKARLDAQDILLNEIKTAVVGNPAFGTTGLVLRVATVERDVAEFQGDKKKVMGAAFVLSLLGTGLMALIEWGLHLFKD
ncbi:hypothetical protein SAMN05444156_3266 [Verrucomicrobium sp. GAS474]|uniref:hypothetical protein n=1 Tax=Verrucomicrobium sp. GAS474 TaxID=1882831 RepID=UPI000879F73F|nr:hypothetical protein [Verrucomicrobium sp. GAS474]SDU30950.1 hypothetical protein SAMN05444156_3212 [Verrucomicrobium sp. GAS474]SDU31832.1 hypothetical protein SAMN05444156_3266 [Verrucomicrobium sp. GAS474]